MRKQALEGPQVHKQTITNQAYIRQQFGSNDDLIVRDFAIGKVKASVIGIQGLISRRELSDEVLAPLMHYQGPVTTDTIANTLSSVSVTQTQSLPQVAQKLAERNAVLFVDGVRTAFLVDVSAMEQRSVTEPANETVVRGPHSGFVENLVTNISLVRRYVNNPQLRVEFITVGQKTRVKLALTYLEGTADARLVADARRRLQDIRLDGILGDGFVEQFVEDAPYSFFPTVRHTERPDTVAGNLLEGRVAIFADGSGTVLIVPHLFIDNFQNTEDYHSRPYYSSFMRIIRFIGFLLSTQFPALYISVEDFHKELLPSPLLISMAGAREGVPFTLTLEIVLMLFAFELIKEAGLRMPRPISSSLSIVAGLILGQAAVDSGFVSITTVIVAAVTGLSSFLVSPIIEGAVLVRFLLLIPASVAGLYGLILADLVLTVHLVSLKSFEVPYLAPVAPSYFKGWKDVFIRVRITKLRSASRQVHHNIGKYLED